MLRGATPNTVLTPSCCCRALNSVACCSAAVGPGVLAVLAVIAVFRGSTLPSLHMPEQLVLLLVLLLPSPELRSLLCGACAPHSTRDAGRRLLADAVCSISCSTWQQPAQGWLSPAAASSLGRVVLPI